MVSGERVGHSGRSAHERLGRKGHSSDREHLQADRASLGPGGLVHRLEERASGGRVDHVDVVDAEQEADEEDKRAGGADAHGGDHHPRGVDVRVRHLLDHVRDGVVARQPE